MAACTRRTAQRNHVAVHLLIQSAHHPCDRAPYDEARDRLDGANRESFGSNAMQPCARAIGGRSDGLAVSRGPTFQQAKEELISLGAKRQDPTVGQ